MMYKRNIYSRVLDLPAGGTGGAGVCTADERTSQLERRSAASASTTSNDTVFVFDSDALSLWFRGDVTRGAVDVDGSLLEPLLFGEDFSCCSDSTGPASLRRCLGLPSALCVPAPS